MSEQALAKSIPLLHWLLAASIFFLFISSWWMLALPLPSDVFTYRELPFQLHKSLGLTLVLLVTVMTATRLIVRSKERHSHSKMHKLAEVDHLVIYVLIASCCLSGYLSSSFSGWGTTLWWVLDLPTWAAENDDLNILFSDIHMWSCWALLAVLTLHIAAALYHAFINDGMINKMFKF